MPASDSTEDNFGDDLTGKAGSRLSVETLALLHADALEVQERDRARAVATADPAARAVLAGLDRVCEQLRSLDEAGPPAEQMPEFVARRVDRELAKLSGSAEGHRRRWAAAAGVGSDNTAAAVLSLVAYASWPWSEQHRAQDDSPLPVAKGQPPTETETEPAGGPLAATRPTIVDNRFRIERKDFSALLSSGSSFKDLGPLSDDAIRGGCLAANGFPENQQLVAAGRIKRGDKEGVFMMIPTPSMVGGAPEMTVLVVGTQCRAGVPATLSKQILSKS